ncbi:MAG: hypothetical protein CBB97_24720 [Candidatus Endolissoclinum sp. TMED37]|nr:MAG: hypothetical protein CBB97_24720 [Candidatus Endolissoclinum sp. TMED37]
MNPLYYSIPREYEKGSITTLKTEFELFKNLNDNLYIDLDKRIFDDTLQLNVDERKKNITKKLDEAYLTEEMILDEKKLKGVFYGGNNVLEDYLVEKNTLFIYIDSFDGDTSLYFKKTLLSNLYKKLDEKEKLDEKLACKIRVYSKNSSITKETLKQTIDLDIENIISRLQKQDLRYPEKKINKIRFFTDYDGRLDYLFLNLTSLKNIEKQKFLELVDYANNKLNEMLKQDIKIKDLKEGRDIETIKFFIFPSIQQPSFIDINKEERDFILFLKDENLKKDIKQLKIKIKKIHIEFKKYIIELREKITRGDSLKQLDDSYLKSFYKLELYPGINGNNVVNLTKSRHEKSFRYKKGTTGYINLSALDAVLIVKMRQILPTGFHEFYLLTKEKIEIGTITLKLTYGEEENTVKIEKIILDDEKIKSPDYDSNLKFYNFKGIDKDVLKNAYYEYFKIGKDGKTKLSGRSGTITRKTRIVKNVIEIESYNLAQANITNPFYIIPLVRFDDKDVAEYLNKDNIDNYKIQNEDLVNILTDNQESYKFYLSVSSNNPDKVYDLEKYSESFKKIKRMENVKYIISKLLQNGKVFRPKKIPGEKPFRGIYKILGYELNNNKLIRIITNGVEENPRIKTDKLTEIKGTHINRTKDDVQLQIDPVTFVNFEYLPKSILSSRPPRSKEITLKIEDTVESSEDILNRVYHVSGLSYEKFKKNENIIRVPIVLYITQNAPKDHKDFECEVKKNKLRKAYEKFMDSYEVFSGKQEKGKYLNKGKLSRLRDKTGKIQQKEIVQQGGMSGMGGLFQLKIF